MHSQKRLIHSIILFSDGSILRHLKTLISENIIKLIFDGALVLKVDMKFFYLLSTVYADRKCST
jgi:hypothetical protein